jgi:nitroreductase
MSDKTVFDKVETGGYREPAPPCDPEAFERVVRSRRSIRVYQNEPIPDDIVHKCIELALLAPNSSNLQPWAFYWVKTPEKKKELAKACLGQPAATTAPVIIVVVARLHAWKRNAQAMLELLKNQQPPAPKAVLDYYGRLVPMAYSQGPLGVLGPIKKVAVTLAGLKKPSPREPTSHSDMRVWAHKSCALACENLMLAFRAYGYDSCPMEGLDSVRVRKLLHLGEGHEVVMAISAGKRAEAGVYGPRIRFDKSQFVFEI